MNAPRFLPAVIALLLLPVMVAGQTIYTYPLSSTLSSVQADGPDLIEIPNNDGLTGEFTTRVVPADPNNFIVFFRDDPSVLAGEASPGFVSSIIIRNLDWTPQEVQEVWENFCSSLLTVKEPADPTINLYPNPVRDKIYYDVSEIVTGQHIAIEVVDIYGKTISYYTTGNLTGEIDFSSVPRGTYVVRILVDEKIFIRKVVR